MAKFVRVPRIFWRIDDFSSLQKKVSPMIKFMGLKFYLNFSRYMESESERLKLSLNCQNAFETSSIEVYDIRCSTVYANGGECLQVNRKYRITCLESCIWNYSLFDITNYLGQAKDITFIVTITPTGDLGKMFSTKQHAEEANEMTPCAANLFEDICGLLNNDECSDFTLKCGDRNFPVHKAVLSARSHFFAGMFRSDMKEASENGSIIEKIEPDILEIVLRYIYTGKLPDLPLDSLRKVSGAADRFIIEPLKIKCLSLFTDIFSSESEESSEKKIEGEQPEFDEPPRTSEKVENDKEKRQILRDLFMTREWRLLKEKYPHDAFEMCKPFLFSSS